MKHFFLAAAVLASPFAAHQANACAMRRPEQIVVVANKPAMKDGMLQARAAETRGERHTAIRLYEAVMNAPGDTAERAAAGVAAARLLALDGQQARAVARAQKAVGLNPRDAAAQLMVGELLVNDEAGRALTHLKRAAALGVAGDEAIRLALAQARAYKAFGDVANARIQLEAARNLGAETAAIAAIEIGLGGQVANSKI